MVIEMVNKNHTLISVEFDFRINLEQLAELENILNEKVREITHGSSVIFSNMNYIKGNW